MRLGADSGGTFTDVVGIDGRILKIPSTRLDPGRAVRSAMTLLAGDRTVEQLAHGTTVATNALLERSGAVVALMTTAGLTDVIEIGRQARPSLYDPWIDRPEPLVARRHRLEVSERLDGSGAVLEPWVPGSLPSVPEGVEAIAVVLLHADLEPIHEQLVATELRAAGFEVSASHEVAPEYREYERTVTTVVNAYLRPACRPYLEGLAGAAASVSVMTSAGGLVDVAAAAATPAALLLSGPAGGVRAAAAVAVACGYRDAISFDMGGTSTDVCLILDGAPAPAADRQVAGLPIRLPSLDVHTVGAGGGSIAEIDAGGALRVGPSSAGAEPGPACYGRGGTRPTVTDADLALGRIPADAAFPGLGILDGAAANEALDAAGLDAAGVIAVVNAQMEQALRAVSVERGVDPASLALVAFGGAGPLHACELAEATGVSVVIVPAAAGVLSAVGLLTSPQRREVVRSWPDPRSVEGLADALDELADRAAALLGPANPGGGAGPGGRTRADGGADPGGRTRADGGAVTTATSLDCRYAGQSHELRVDRLEDFAAEHLSRNGYDLPDTPVEVVALRAVAEAPALATIEDVLSRAQRQPVEPITGPQVVAREDCTIWVPEGWSGRPGALGSLVLTRSGPGT